VFFDEEPARRNFTTKTKKIEWLSVAGKGLEEYLRDSRKFLKTSFCRRCHRKLTWGDRTYEFDHKDNNPRNNNQRNCYLVCRICHAKATKIEKRAVEGILGVEYQTIKRKIGYKKPRKVKVVKKRSSRKKPVITKRKTTSKRPTGAGRKSAKKRAVSRTLVRRKRK
jgi:hypothetical protein